jgi:hypothetical protein
VKWVSDLINSDSRSWDEPLVRSIFYPPDADEVLWIPLSSAPNEDSIAWAHEPNGLFSVRSAYRLGMQMKNGANQKPVALTISVIDHSGNSFGTLMSLQKLKCLLGNLPLTPLVSRSLGAEEIWT